MLKERNPYFVFFMIFLTLGIYFFIWVYKVNSEIGEEYKKGPNSIMLIIFFCIPLVGWVVWLKWLNHIKIYQDKMNFKNRVNIFLIFILALFLWPLGCALVQNTLNKK